MARIVPKLNLNKTPQSVDTNSLIFAKNVKLLKDNTIGRDNGIINIPLDTLSSNALQGFQLKGYIPYNTTVYLFFYKDAISVEEPETAESVIYKYDEFTNTLTKCNTGWKYSGGIIEGMATVNLRNDTLLTINEYFEDYDETTNPLIPLKTINLSESTDEDDESIYSNAPIIPLINLVTIGTYDNIIPNGVYQFFVRFEIKKDYFTSWFQCSEELFTANIYQSDTAQGSVRYIDTRINANESFVFNVEKLNTAFNSIYKSFQLGYIISHDDTIKAKIWKKFPMNTNTIFFDYTEEYTKDIDITELLRPVLNLYNVKNLTNFKNKFYISNYIESDYNKADLADLVKRWSVDYEAIPVKNIGRYLYKGLNANDEEITYVDASDDEQTEDIITSFGNYTNIASILQNRSVLLTGNPSDSTVTTEETNIHNSLNDSSYYDNFVSEIGELTPLFVAYEDCYSTTPEDFNSTLARNDMARWFNKKYCGINQEEISYDFYSLKRVVAIRDTSDPTSSTDSSVDRENIYLDIDDEFSYELEDGVYSTNGEGRNYVRNNFAIDIQGFLGEGVNKGKTVIKYEDPDTNEHTIVVNKFREFFNSFHLRKSTDTGGIGAVYVASSYTFGGHTCNVPNDGKHYYMFFIKYREQYRDYSYNLISTDITKGSNFEKSNVKTLIPFQSYNFYIHFVKDTGEITNGYFIANYIQPYLTECKDHVQLVPKFTYTKDGTSYTTYKETLESYGYSYYFFSMCKTGKQVAELINRSYFEKDTRENNNPVYGTMFDCIDIDTLQLPLVTDIPIYELTASDNAKTNPQTIAANYRGIYVDSGQLEQECTRLFGASGKVVIKDTNLNSVNHTNYFIILDTEVNTDILDLVKCTKYFKLNDAGEFDGNYLTILDVTANLQDYICTVSKQVNNELDNFISSSDYYEKDIVAVGSHTELVEGNSETVNDYTIRLNEVNTLMPYVHTPTQLIYSTFNLNFLALTNDIQRLVRKYTYTDNNDEVTTKQLTACFNSITLSDLYTFPSMYKNYTRKYYDVYDEESMVVYNNTIRCSELAGDEEKTFVYKFLAEVTYNVPTDKGIIVNLISAGDVVLVHTQDSLYKFTGKVALSSADTNVQTVESDIFDTGIQEVVGSRYGFAGLKNKYHALLSQFGYIFWDAVVNVIYAYTGEGQMSPISDPISKLLNYDEITDIRFCEDYYSDRFLMKITYKHTAANNTITYSDVVLSYNVKAKSFVSLHDFTFDKTFNTRTSTYFTKIISGTNKLYKLSDKIVGYGDLLKTNSVYPSIIFPVKPEKPCAVIDIIFNDNYEFIKTLDSISWICSEIDNLHIAPTNTGYLLLAEEALDRTYPGNRLFIYSDSCYSENLDITKASNDYGFYKRLSSGNYIDVKQNTITPTSEARDKNNHISELYKMPRYNLGKWSFNYFRNVKNNNNINALTPSTYGKFSDNNSLIYGKYFVFRFVFDIDVNFKFENLTVNINNNYGNN